MAGLNALGSDAHDLDRARANDQFLLILALEEIQREGAAHDGRHPDGTQRLCDVLYGKEIVVKWIGGSNAAMLHDAADEISKLREQSKNWQESVKNLAEASAPISEDSVKYRDALEKIVAWSDGAMLRIAREALGIEKEDFVIQRRRLQDKHPLL